MLSLIDNHNYLRADNMGRLSAFFSKDKELLEQLSRLIGFYPDNVELFKLAFRSKSAQAQDNNDFANNNERLEYLGDAILGSIVAEFLFKQFPFKDEGFLTEMRSKIVSRDYLNKLALKLGLNDFMTEGGDNLGKSVYGDAFEALVGAIYLDKGYNSVQNFIVNRIIQYHVDIEELESKELNFKGKLIDWGQKERKEVKFELVEEIGDGYAKKYRIVVLVERERFGEAIDFSKKKAEQRAAEITLENKQFILLNMSESK